MASCVAKSSAPTELSQCRIWYIKYENSFAFSKTHLARKRLTARFSFVLRSRYYFRKIAYGLFTMKIQNWHSGSSVTNRYFFSSAESPPDSVYEGIEKKIINPRKAVYKVIEDIYPGGTSHDLYWKTFKDRTIIDWLVYWGMNDIYGNKK